MKSVKKLTCTILFVHERCEQVVIMQARFFHEECAGASFFFFFS